MVLNWFINVHIIDLFVQYTDLFILKLIQAVYPNIVLIRAVGTPHKYTAYTETVHRNDDIFLKKFLIHICSFEYIST